MGEPATLQNKTSCWICFNNENIITLTELNGEQLLKHFKTCLDTSINIKTFEKKTHVECCSYCYESSRQLTNLEEQVKKLQKEISDFSLLFSKTVLDRRTLVENEKDRSANILTPQVGKCFKIENNPDRDSIAVLENAIVKTEVNESVSKELRSDSHEEKDNLLTNSWFDTVEHENVTKDQCKNVFHSNDQIDIKYSCDETSLKVADTVKKEIVLNQQMSTTSEHGVQKRKIMSMSELLKSVKMPVIQLERHLPGRSRNAPNIVDCAGEEKVKCENAPDDSNKANNGSKTLSKELPFKCSEIACSKSFKTKWVLERHQKTHSGDRPYKRSLCSKSFKQKIHLTVHGRIHSGQKLYKCNLCEKSFARSDNLRVHKMIHSGKKPYQCSLCEKSFGHPNYLKVHGRVHTGERPYNCSFCSKSFFQSCDAKRHERIHTGERPYNCSFCSKSFRRLAKAKMHEMTHTGEKPHKCSFCSKSFLRSDVAKMHEMTHTGEKPHKCSSCGKTFRKRGNLTKHYNRMHGETENKEEYILS